MPTVVCRFAFVCACVVVAACHGGGGGGYGGGGNSTTYTVGGTVSGLAGTGLVLQNNGGNNLAVSANGAFTFSTALASGAAYGVTVSTQPSNPSQMCTVTSGSGSVGSANVTSVQLTCSTSSYTVGGTVSGLDVADTGLVLQNNAGNDLTISGNGAFSFTTAVASGAGYAVTVKTQPNTGPLQNCSVTNGSGTVGGAAVTNVTVSCVTRTAKFVMVTNPGSPVGMGTGANTVSVYTVDATTGALTAVAGSPFATEPNPRFVTAEPSGKFVYVTTQGSSTNPPRISGFQLNGTTGALTELANSPFDLSASAPAPGSLSITAPAIHPSGSFGYVTVLGPPPNPSATLYGATIDTTTGDLAEVAGMPLSVGTAAINAFFDPVGKYLFVPTNVSPTGGQITSFNVSSPSGVLTQNGAPVGTGGTTPFSGITPDGKFVLSSNLGSGTLSVFGVDSAGTLAMVGGSPFATGVPSPGPFAYFRRMNMVYVQNTIAPGGLAGFAFNSTTGALTALPNSPYSTNGATLFPFLHPSGKFLYQVNGTTASIQRYSIDQATGVPTLLADVTTPADAPSILIPDPSARFVYVSSASTGNVSSYSVDQTTGALTLVNTVAAGAGAFIPLPVGLQ